MEKQMLVNTFLLLRLAPMTYMTQYNAMQIPESKLQHQI